MTDVHRIFGSELSPYSVKVRSYFRYKKIPHQWVVRDTTNQAEFQEHAKLPLIPLVIAPDGKSYQDSTPIIEHFEAEFPEPAIQPEDPALAFVSAMIEEYADEWGNKPMFHYRWFYEPDQESAADRIARSMMPGMDEESLSSVAAQVKGRMVPRLKFVGSSEQTKGPIEASFKRQIGILEKHLSARPFLFGGRPALGDFGLYAQLYECLTDPTPGGIMRAEAPRVVAWIERMLDPSAAGGFESWDRLEVSLMPLLADEIAAIFFPWSAANAQAIAKGEKEFHVTLGGEAFTQETQKYHAKSLGVLRARYAAVADKSRLDPILERSGCAQWLR